MPATAVKAAAMEATGPMKGAPTKAAAVEAAREASPMGAEPLLSELAGGSRPAPDCRAPASSRGADRGRAGSRRRRGPWHRSLCRPRSGVRSRSAPQARSAARYPIGVIAPDPRARLQLRARSVAGRAGDALLLLTRVGGRAHVDVQAAPRVDGERMHGMVAAQWHAGDDDLGRPAGGDPGGGQPVAHNAIVDLGVKGAVVERDLGAHGASGLRAVAETHLDVGSAVAVGVAQRHQESAGRWRVVGVVATAPGDDAYHSAWRDHEMAGVADTVREDGVAEAERERQTSVVGCTHDLRRSTGGPLRDLGSPPAAAEQEADCQQRRPAPSPPITHRSPSDEESPRRLGRRWREWRRSAALVSARM